MPEKETLSKKAARFIADKRAVLEMSQYELAKKAFKNPNRRSFISEIESGKRDILISTLSKILCHIKSDIVLISHGGATVHGSDPIKTAQFIKQQRLGMGLSQSKLADLVYGDKTMRSHISNLETGKTEISLISLGYILPALNSELQFVE